ncbi:MAG: hypothetical protein LUD14_08120 [Clostridiales bacterium]|nr:hypothetical protein [Clostridiales bacterium]
MKRYRTSPARIAAMASERFPPSSRQKLPAPIPEARICFQWDFPSV